MVHMLGSWHTYCRRCVFTARTQLHGSCLLSALHASFPGLHAPRQRRSVRPGSCRSFCSRCEALQDYMFRDAPAPQRAPSSAGSERAAHAQPRPTAGATAGARLCWAGSVPSTRTGMSAPRQAPCCAARAQRPRQRHRRSKPLLCRLRLGSLGGPVPRRLVARRPLLHGRVGRRRLRRRGARVHPAGLHHLLHAPIVLAPVHSLHTSYQPCENQEGTALQPVTRPSSWPPAPGKASSANKC